MQYEKLKVCHAETMEFFFERHEAVLFGQDRILTETYFYDELHWKVKY